MKRNANAVVKSQLFPNPSKAQCPERPKLLRAPHQMRFRTSSPRTVQNVKYMSGRSRLRRTSLSLQERVVVVQPPNPSIEGMPKRLRLLCTPHVKR